MPEAPPRRDAVQHLACKLGFDFTVPPNSIHPIQFSTTRQKAPLASFLLPVHTAASQTTSASLKAVERKLIIRD